MQTSGLDTPDTSKIAGLDTSDITKVVSVRRASDTRGFDLIRSQLRFYNGLIPCIKECNLPSFISRP